MSNLPFRSLALETTDPLTRQLLESARADSSEPGARDRALVGLGLASASFFGATGNAAACAPPVAATTTGAGNLVAASGKGGLWLLGKSIAVGLVGSVVAIGALNRTLGEPAHVSASASVTATAPADAPPPERASSMAPAPTAEAPKSSALWPTARVASPEPQRAEQIKPDDLARDLTGPSSARYGDAMAALAALARVRGALTVREPGRALSLLDEFDRRFPASQVAEEAAVLRIEALGALGRTTEARALGLSFLRDQPRSVYAARVRAATPIR